MERRLSNEDHTTIEHVPLALVTLWVCVCVCALETGLRVLWRNSATNSKEDGRDQSGHPSSSSSASLTKGAFFDDTRQPILSSAEQTARRFCSILEFECEDTNEDEDDGDNEDKAEVVALVLDSKQR